MFPCGSPGAQRPEASSSRSRRAIAICAAGVEVLNARRRHRLDHSGLGRTSVSAQGCVLNARRRHRLDHIQRVGGLSEDVAVLNARRRHRLDHLTHVAALIGQVGVHNARRRHRLDHGGRPKMQQLSQDGRCSTPGGVIVSITRHLVGIEQRRQVVLNARRRHRLDHRNISGR